MLYFTIFFTDKLVTAIYRPGHYIKVMTTVAEKKSRAVAECIEKRIKHKKLRVDGCPEAERI